MPRQRSPDREKAKEMYLQHKGEMLLSEIADKLNLPEGTIRGWKNKDLWDGELKKNTERSKRNTERSEQNAKNSFRLNTSEKASNKSAADKENKKTKTNTPRSERSERSKQQRFGNQNAVGNKGGVGAPPRNKHAFKTGEYETIFFNEIVDENERALLEADYDKYSQQFILIDTLTIRELRIMELIKELKNTPGGMVFESITKTKGTLEGTSHVAKPVLIRIMQLEESLTRIEARKQNAIKQLHLMQIADDILTLNGIKTDLSVVKTEAAIQLNTEEEVETSNFIEALETVTGEAWKDE